jgi:hypothetical protein
VLRVFFIFFVILIFPLCALYGREEENLLKIQKTTDEINFDGICDEPLWNSIESVVLKMFRPNHGQASSEKSEVFVTFDDQYLYLAGRLYYTNGAKVRATTKKRDPDVPGNDHFGILLDTFNDNESALCFETNPTGSRSDFAIAHDAQTSLRQRPFNRSWNTFWDIETSMQGDIWHVEMRIPFSSLRFQDEDGDVIMGMTIWRMIASVQEFAVFPLITNEFGTFGLWKPSQAQKILLKGVTRTKPVYITPYALAGIEQSAEMNNDETQYVQNNDYTLTAGLDLKYPVTSNMTLDLTLNTDFAQVDVDDHMFNLTRFSLFFPEKRQFFLERSSLFTIKTGYMDELFYSRRIGLYEEDIIPIYGGVRLVGRAGKYDIGFMDMQTAEHDYYNEDEDSIEHIASTNYGIMRLRKQIINPRSYVGGMVTSKIDVNGRYNINAALDGIFNVFRNDYFTFNYVQTFDTDLPYNNDFIDHSKFYLNWENRSNVGFGYELFLSRGGKYYDPEMGFELMEDYSRFFGSLSYGWVYNEEEKKMLSQQIMAWIWENKRNSDWVTDIRKISLGYNFSLKKGYRGNFMLINSYENLDELFELSDDVFFPVGEYRYTNLELGFSTPSNKLVSLRTLATIGSYYDGKILNLGPAMISLRPSASVNLGLDYQYSLVDIDPRDQRFTSHLVRLKTEFTFTTKLSLLMFFQYSSNDKFGVNNVRFRYNPREGNDLYIVYNEEYNTHLDREIPELPFSEIRKLIVKYTYTFTIQNKRKKQKKHIINYRHN